VKLNHLDLQVADAQRSVHLFEQLLGFQLDSSRTFPALALLSDGAGFTLVLQRRQNDADAYARESGLVEVSGVIENGRGVLVYLRSWDGLLIEVSWQRPRHHRGDQESAKR